MGLDTRNDRRQFLTTTLWGGLFAFARPCRAWAILTAQRKGSTLGPGLVQLLRHKESARIIGLEYLRGAPQEAHVQTLIDLLSSDFTQSPIGPHKSDTTRLREFLRLQTQQDFEAGRIVRLQGWMISVTEARLCALVALA